MVVNYHSAINLCIVNEHDYVLFCILMFISSEDQPAIHLIFHSFDQRRSTQLGQILINFHSLSLFQSKNVLIMISLLLCCELLHLIKVYSSFDTELKVGEEHAPGRSTEDLYEHNPKQTPEQIRESS
jgi:hypothetical protein